LGTIPAPEDLAERLDSVTALVEHGLFIGIAKTAILATSSGIKTMSV
jgi:ribose 5-phosphate isomerase A